MIFPGFPGVLSFFQVFQVEWEPWRLVSESVTISVNVPLDTQYKAWELISKHLFYSDDLHLS